MQHALGGRDSEGLLWRTGGNGAEKLTKISLQKVLDPAQLSGE